MTVRSTVEAARCILEALCAYKGNVRLDGAMIRTGNFKNSGPHTRNENQAYTKWRPQVSGTSIGSSLCKPNLNILGLDTTAQDDDGKYEYRAKCAVRGFNYSWVNRPIFFPGEYSPSFEDKTIWPQIPDHLVSAFVPIGSECFLHRHRLDKVEDKIKSLGRSLGLLPAGIPRVPSGEVTVRVETPMPHAEINWKVISTPPKYSWTAYKDEDGYNDLVKERGELWGKIDHIVSLMRTLANADYLSALPVEEQIRAIELGLMETGQDVKVGVAGFTIIEERIEATYVPLEQANEIVSGGRGSFASYTDKSGNATCKVIANPTN